MSKSATLPRIRSKARPASQRPRLVEHELDRAQTRIRTVDTLYSVCLLIGGLLTYLLVIIGLDYWLRLGDGTRQVLWITAGLGGLAFIAVRIVYPLIQHINPYYTARMIEKSNPGSRNGIINWLDLREEKISPIIRDALSRRAVHELDSANLEEAIPTRKPLRTGIIVGAILLALMAVAFILPDQVGSLFKRAIFPFQPAIIPTHTRLEVLSPITEPIPDVDVETLPVREVQVERGQPVEFRVIAWGQTPAEVLFESQAVGDKQPIVKPMRQDKKNGDPQQPWRVALSSSDIPVDGFLFRFRANDGLTRQFKLVVTSRTPPSVSDLEVKLNYPAYTGRRPITQGMGPIKAIEGTKVDITITADRPAASGELEVIEEITSDDNKIIPVRRQNIKLVRPAGDSDENKLTLAEPLWLIPGYFSKDEKQKFFYQLALVSPENLTGISPKYPLEVMPDLAPRVEIKKVKDIVLNKDKKQDEFEVESNAVIPIAGTAHDDIAMGEVTMKLKTSDGRDLFFLGAPPAEKNLQKANGYTPEPVNFLLTLDLAKLTFQDRARTGNAIQLKPGTIVEVVIEGSDTAEPKPHVGTSQLIKLKVKGEASQEERKEQEKKAEDQQKQHEQQKKDRQEQQPENNQEKGEKNESDKKEGRKNKDGSQKERGNQSDEKNKDSEKDKNTTEKSKSGDRNKSKDDPARIQIDVISPTIEDAPEVDVETLPVKNVLTEQGQPVEFRVFTRGAAPARVKLMYQVPGNNPIQSKDMTRAHRGDNTQPWRTTLSGDEVLPDGIIFWFQADPAPGAQLKLRDGDGLTRKFRLNLTNKPAPRADNFDIRLHFPEYTKRQSRAQSAGPIKAIEGTRASLVVTSDRPLLSVGYLEVTEELTAENGTITSVHRESIPMARPANSNSVDRLTLKEPLKLAARYITRNNQQKFYYQLFVVSAEEQMGKSTRHLLETIPDQIPQVEIQTVMGKALAKGQTELEVAANAVVPIGGIAQDDVAVKDITINIKDNKGQRWYVAGQQQPGLKNVQRPTGGVPPPVPFLFTIDLDKMTTQSDFVTAKPEYFEEGTVLEVQVEATDSAEPVPHTGKSQVIKLKLTGKLTSLERDDQANKAARMKEQTDEKQKNNDKQQKQQEEQNDKNLKKDKQENGDPEEKQPGEKGEKQPGEKGEKQPGEKGEKQPGEKGEKQPGEKGEKQPGEKGEKQPGEKGEKQPGEKGEKQPGEKGEKQPGEKGEKQPGEKGEKQPGEKGEKQPGEKGEKQPGEKGEKQPGEKGEKQPGEKGEKQPGEKGEKQPGEKGEKQPGEKGEKQPGEKGEKQPGDKPSDKPGEGQGQAGLGKGNDSSDAGSLEQLLKQVTKDDKAPEKTNFNPKPAEGESKNARGGPSKVDENAAKQRDIALDNLADKLRRNDIDKQLGEKLKDLRLSREDALKLIENQKLQRVKGTGKAADQGPDKALTGIKQRTEQIIDSAVLPPDELASSYRTFTEKRNQPKDQPRK